MRPENLKKLNTDTLGGACAKALRQGDQQGWRVRALTELRGQTYREACWSPGLFSHRVGAAEEVTDMIFHSSRAPLFDRTAEDKKAQDTSSRADPHSGSFLRGSPRNSARSAGVDVRGTEHLPGEPRHTVTNPQRSPWSWSQQEPEVTSHVHSFLQPLLPPLLPGQTGESMVCTHILPYTGSTHSPPRQGPCPGPPPRAGTGVSTGPTQATPVHMISPLPNSEGPTGLQASKDPWRTGLPPRFQQPSGLCISSPE